jgi:SAM-dependent methyltransferase
MYPNDDTAMTNERPGMNDSAGDGASGAAGPRTDAPVPVESIIGELIGLQRDGAPLEVFGSRISALQYMHAYRETRAALPGGCSVLDWGCGRGHFSYFLLRSGYRLTCFSLEDFPMVLEPFRDRLTFVAGSAGEPRLLPFADGEFDAVFSIGVLEHVRETGGSEAGSLREIHRILRPGGTFLCAHLPNRLSWNEFVTRFLLPSRFHHRYRFRRRDIVRLWEGAGLEIQSLRRYCWLPRNMFSTGFSGLSGRPSALRCFLLAEAAASAIFHPFHQNFLVVSRKAGGRA